MSAGRGGVIWFTGLSGSGKSTLARRLRDHLERAGRPTELLDGDALRALFPGTGFTRAERDLHIRRAGHIAALLEKHGVSVVAAFVSPYAEARRFVRGLCRDFIEVHVSTPLAVCEQRDVKGLYAGARRGEIGGLTGIDDPYEAPAAPEFVIDTTDVSEADAAAAVIRFVEARLGAERAG
ncbi:MAG TPA: adenylyl-sulfate kinase [Elusimicrobia bacterium]|nr:adenylyl-sulfate kinase [Elusimicrobiota bacterium]